MVGLVLSEFIFKKGDIVKSRLNNYYEILYRTKDSSNTKWYFIKNLSNKKIYPVLIEKCHKRHTLVTDEIEKILFGPEGR